MGLRRRRDVLLALVATRAGRAQTLAEQRARIDALDRRIVALLHQRAEVVQAIGRWKGQAGQAVTAPAREQEVLRNAMAAAGALPPESVRRIYESVLTEMKAAERLAMSK